MAAYFADTSFWMALSRKRDQSNRHAVAWNQFVIRTRSSIVTTEAVLLGVAERPLRREHSRRCSGGLPPRPCGRRIEVVPFQPELIDSAVQLYRTRPDKNWSLTDCLSIVVMERRHLTDALTTDGHLEQAGLKVMLLVQPPLGV